MIKKVSLVVAVLIAGVQAVNIGVQTQVDSGFGFRDMIAEKVNKMAGGEKDKI